MIHWPVCYRRKYRSTAGSSGPAGPATGDSDSHRAQQLQSSGWCSKVTAGTAGAPGSGTCIDWQLDMYIQYILDICGPQSSIFALIQSRELAWVLAH